MRARYTAFVTREIGAFPVMGFVGAAMIASWSWGLMRSTGAVLVDRRGNGNLDAEVRTAIEGEADNKVADLHLWQVGPGHWAAIVSVVTANPCDPSHYRTLLAPVHELSHVTIEVHRCRPEGDAGTLLGAGTVTQA